MSVDNLLSKLHEKLTKKLLAMVEKDEITAAELNVIRQFLKDNNVDALPVEGSPMGDLLAKLPDDLRKSLRN